jgi:hypothetical protein
MLRKTKEQGVLRIFDKTDDLSKVSNQAEEIIRNADRVDNCINKNVSEEQKSKKLSGFNPVTSNGSSIISARAGNITDMGGPKKQIKTESSNSIFDNNKLFDLTKTIDSKTATKIEKAENQSNRRTAENKRVENLFTEINKVNTSKASSVFRTNTGNLDTSNYNTPSLNMSIFDNKDFERVPDKTSGEKVSEDASFKRSQKDESWKNNGKSITSKDLNNSFFNNLIRGLDK